MHSASAEACAVGMRIAEQSAITAAEISCGFIFNSYCWEEYRHRADALYVAKIWSSNFSSRLRNLFSTLLPG